jgi:hypothetical protein
VIQKMFMLWFGDNLTVENPEIILGRVRKVEE